MEGPGFGWNAPPPSAPEAVPAFYIQNVQTGLVLHINNEDRESGGVVIMERKTGSPAQLWTYRNNAICSLLNDTLVLDVEEGTGPNVITYLAHFGPNQQWQFRDETSTVVSSTGEVLDVDGGSTEPGARVIVWDEHGGLNQKFIRVYA